MSTNQAFSEREEGRDWTPVPELNALEGTAAIHMPTTGVAMTLRQVPGPSWVASEARTNSLTFRVSDGDVIGRWQSESSNGSGADVMIPGAPQTVSRRQGRFDYRSGGWCYTQLGKNSTEIHRGGQTISLPNEGDEAPLQFGDVVWFEEGLAFRVMR